MEYVEFGKSFPTRKIDPNSNVDLVAKIGVDTAENELKNTFFWPTHGLSSQTFFNFAKQTDKFYLKF